MQKDANGHETGPYYSAGKKKQVPKNSSFFLQRASHSETGGDRDDDSDVYTPEITTNNVYPEAIVKPDSGHVNSDNISADDHIDATKKSPGEEQDMEECCNNDISELGIPVESSETCSSQGEAVNNSSSTIM